MFEYIAVAHSMKKNYEPSLSWKDDGLLCCRTECLVASVRREWL